MPGAIISFRVAGEGSGVLSQPSAITDAAGLAETYLLNARPGLGEVVATSGEGTTLFDFRVRRAPGEIVFDAGEGVPGLPGFPHPDSVIRARVLDTEGDPLPGAVLWFSAPGDLRNYNDTTDAEGYAETRLRRTFLPANDGWVFGFILGFPQVTTRTTRSVVQPAERVVLVSIDGLRGDALARHNPPTLSRLAAEGAFTDRALSVIPSLTVPAHLSMLAGVPPVDHGVFGDHVEFTQEMARLRPLFRFARDEGGVSAAAFLSDEGPLAGFRDALQCRQAFGLDSLALVASSGSAVAEAAAPVLGGSSVDLFFLHVPDTDAAGHQYGWSSPEYGAAVLRADSAVASILEEGSVAGRSTLFVITSPHGGGGAYGDYLSGSDAPEDVEVPVILWGPHVAPGALDDVSLLDIAPTILWALGMSPPSSYQGSILFQGFGS